MKKIVLVLLSMFIFLTGCGSKIDSDQLMKDLKDKGVTKDKVRYEMKKINDISVIDEEEKSEYGIKMLKSKIKIEFEDTDKKSTITCEGNIGYVMMGSKWEYTDFSVDEKTINVK